MPRLACIGTGRWGRNLVRNFYEVGALASVCDLDERRVAEILEGYHGIEPSTSSDAVLSDPGIDAVAIATPAETHGRLVREALEAGKDVFVEKPLCLSVDEGKKLVDYARLHRRVLMVGHVLWYHPAVLRLKELVEEGTIGRLQYIYSNRLNLGRIRHEENILWSFAPHDISVILGLVGDMPESVRATGGNYLQTRIADVTLSTMSFANGVNAHVFVSWLHPFKEQKLIVVGDRGMLVFDDVEERDKLKLYPHSIAWKNHVPVAEPSHALAVECDRVEPLRAEVLHFLDCVRRRSVPRTDGREALRVLDVLQRCQQSLDLDLRSRIPREMAGGVRPSLDRSPPQGSSSPGLVSAPSSNGERAWFAHETTVIDDDVEIGAGTKIWHFSHVLSGSRIGERCSFGQNVVVGPNVTVGTGVKVQNNVSIYEGVTLEDDVFCGPSMVFTNVYNPRSEIRRMDEIRPTLVRRGASLGANCTILCGITVGRYAFLGAGAVVLRDVPDHGLVVGNPGRLVGWMCACGHRLHFAADSAETTCGECGKTFARSENEVRESQEDTVHA